MVRFSFSVVLGQSSLLKINLLIVRPVKENGPNRALLWLFRLHILGEVVVALDLLSKGVRGSAMRFSLLALMNVAAAAVVARWFLRGQATKDILSAWQRRWSRLGKDWLPWEEECRLRLVLVLVLERRGEKEKKKKRACR